MRILIATNYLKGSLSAIKAAQVIRDSLLEINNEPDVNLCPIADGGDGTLDAVSLCTKCEEKIIQVSNPLGEKIKAKWLLLENNVAIIEAAQANGLSLLTPEQYNPLITSTYGVGELIKDALDNNCNQIYITIGGSSTNDGGVGLLQSLDASFRDSQGGEISYGGGALEKLCSIDLSRLDKRLKDTEIIVACDVDNPLAGLNGASYVYAPQKGANQDKVKLLDSNLSRLADITAQHLGKDYKSLQGTGAAGGMGFGLKAFLGAEMISGFDFVAEICKLEEKIKTADVVITTEGRLDSQTMSGKAPYLLAQMATKYEVPVIIIAGSVEQGLSFSESEFSVVISMTDNTTSINDAINNAEVILAKTVIKSFEKITGCQQKS